MFGQKLEPNFESPKSGEIRQPMYSIEKLRDRTIKLCEIAFKRRAVGNEL